MKFVGKGFLNFVFKIKYCKKLFDLFKFSYEILVVILGIVMGLYSEVVL